MPTKPAKKTCIDCLRRLTLEHFYRLHKGSSERQSRCKACDNVKRVQSARTRAGRGTPSIVRLRLPVFYDLPGLQLGTVSWKRADAYEAIRRIRAALRGPPKGLGSN